MINCNAFRGLLKEFDTSEFENYLFMGRKDQGTWIEFHFKEISVFRICPYCKELTPLQSKGFTRCYYRHNRREGQNCFLVVQKHRYTCKTCGKTFTKLPEFVHPNCKFTWKYLRELKNKINLQLTDIARIANQENIPKTTLRSIYRKFLLHKEISTHQIDSYQNVTCICIDEVLVTKGVYYTVISNKHTGKILSFIKGRKVCHLIKVIDKVPFNIRLNIKEVVIDMSNGYDWFAKEAFLNAVITTDRFHLEKRVFKAVQDIRIKKKKRAKMLEYQKKKERLENGETKAQLLHRSRYLLFKHTKDWNYHQKNRANILFREYPKIKIAYHLAHDLKRWYEKKHNKQKAEKSLHQWYKKVNQSGIPEMMLAKKTIISHEGTILNYFINRSTNGLAESLNERVKLLKRLVRGINNPTFFTLRLIPYLFYFPPTKKS